MPPKKRARNSIHATKANTPARNSEPADSIIAPTAEMDTDDPAENAPTEIDIQNSTWTNEQESALFKAIMRWKPAGLHKHFRMIAISEYLRSLGHDPDIYPHMRIPAIWQKLRSFYNLDLVDDRELMDVDVDDDEPEPSATQFYLPAGQFLELIQARVRATDQDEQSEDEPTSPSAQASVPDTPSSPSPPEPKRRRMSRAARNSRRASLAGAYDTEGGTDATPPPAPTTRGGRGSGSVRGGRRGARAGRTAARAVRSDSTEEEEGGGAAGDEDGEESSDDNSETVSARSVTPATRARTRSGTTTRGTRGRGRRARGRSA